MLKDLYLRLALSGVLATLLTTVLDEVAFYSHLVQGSDILTYVASVLLPDTENLDKPSAKVTSLLGHLVMGAGFGIVCGLVLALSGSGYAYLKGMGVGAFYGLFFHQALTAKFWVKPNANITARDATYEFMKHVLLGGLTILISYWLF